MRILAIGDAVTPTGFARVLHALLGRLCRTHEIHHLGLNYTGDPHPHPWKIYPAGTKGDRFGLNRVPELIDQLSPDLIFMLGDPWLLMQYAGVLERHRAKPAVVTYFPVESDPLEPAILTHLLPVATAIATYTSFGADQVRQACAIARTANPLLPEAKLHVVPHGVDRSDFHPLVAIGHDWRQRSLKLARSRLFPQQPDLADAFIILNANRNQPRKRIDVTMEAFALFAKDKPANVHLYLHMARQDLGWDIQRLAARLGISARLLLTRDDNKCRDESNEKLNLIYNACDIGVNTSSAEGWGLVAFEHGAVGAAQIVPRHTSQIELWEGAAILVDPSFSLITENILTRAYYVSAGAVAGAMEQLYQNPKYLHELGVTAQQRATAPQLDWNRIADDLRGIFSFSLAQQQRTQT